MSDGKISIQVQFSEDNIVWMDYPFTTPAELPSEITEADILRWQEPGVDGVMGWAYLLRTVDGSYPIVGFDANSVDAGYDGNGSPIPLPTLDDFATTTDPPKPMQLPSFVSIPGSAPRCPAAVVGLV